MPVLVREHHLDFMGHVNNASYLEILEEARWEWLASFGIGVEQVRQLQNGPVVLGIEIQFLKELKLREQIMVESRMLKWAGKVGTMEQRILRNQTEEACRATLSFGILDIERRKLIEPAQPWSEILRVE
jgi:acyl-CoA thioester hydrolase